MEGRVQQKPCQEILNPRQAIDHISSLISLSLSIRVFSVKWQLIRNKLQELINGLVSSEDCDFSDDPSLLSGPIEGVLVVVNESFNLARRCLNFSFSGKLLMQSDLDVLVTKLDCHVKGLLKIVGSGKLCHDHDIVVAMPGVGASKKDVQFYVGDLLTRMKIGELDLKRQSLMNLNELLHRDVGFSRIVVEIDDVVNLLVSFLDSLEVEIQEEATSFVVLVSRHESCKGVLISAGVIGPLVRVLGCGSDVSREGCATCLMNLTRDSDNAWSVSANGGVSALLKICASGDSGVGLISPACGVLRNLVRVEEIKRFMIEEGVITIVIDLLRSRYESLLISTMDFLQELVLDNDMIKEMVIREGAIPVLASIMDPVSSSSISLKTREIALRAIVHLCCNLQNCNDVVLSYNGFDDVLVYYLQNKDAAVQELALKFGFKLCEASEEAKKSLGNAGFMEELVRFLDAKSRKIRELAAQALSMMVLVPKNRKRLLQDDQNIASLVGLLDKEGENSEIKRLMLSTLMSLAGSRTGKSKIVNAGCLEKVEKLLRIEACEHEAKKLARKLFVNRFRSMLSGVLHF